MSYSNPNQEKMNSRASSANNIENEHIMKLNDLCKELNTDSYDGLTCKHARYLLKITGYNKYSRPENLSKGNMILGKLTRSKNGNHWSKKDWDQIFNSRLNIDYSVIRDSRKCTIKGKEIVRGDLIFLRAGQTVPADIRIISYGGEFIVDNRIITGNPAETKTNVPTSADFLLSQNIIFANTVILNGSCEGIVLKTGDETVFGELTQFATKVKYVPRNRFSSMSTGSSMSIGGMSLPSSLSLDSQGSSLSEAPSTLSL